MKRSFLTLAALALALCLVLTACAQPAAEPTAAPTDEPAAEPTAEATEEPAAEPTAEATEEPAAEPTAEATEEPAAEPTAVASEDPAAEPTAAPEGGASGAPEGITPVETSAEAPAKLGEWVETMRYSATDSAYHTVYYRITNVVRGEGAQAAVDAYNAEDHVVVFNDLESDDLEYCMIEYEVYFPADFPQADYGITSVDINFSVASPDGGGIKANGLSYIGLSSVWDISESPEINEFYAGQTFTEGRAIFAMVKGVSDYVFEVTYYGDSSEAHTSYVQGV